MTQIGRYGWSYRHLPSLPRYSSGVVVTRLVVGFSFVRIEAEAHAVSHMVQMVECIK